MQAASYVMTPEERRASSGLASIYGLRMLGLFIILPVFALYAEHLPGGESHFLIGLALGAYGLTQAVLQIPAGWMSDRYGRKPIIYAGLLLFGIGSLIAAMADNIYWIIIGRAIQGAGAINAAIMALAADLTREEVRSKTMAMIGLTIGVTFSLSLILSPLLNNMLGVPGIFALTGALSILAMLVVRYAIPDPAITRFHSDTEPNAKRFRDVLRNPDLLRLDFGIFTVHAILMSVFIQVPFLLKNNALAIEQHWHVYLPVMVLAFLLMAPFFMMARKKGKLKTVFLMAIMLAMISQIMLMFLQSSVWGIAAALLVFFTAFNVLEAKLPSLISIIAPLSARGTAMGVYSSVQFLGAFFGAAVGGALMQYAGGNAVFMFSAAMLFVWLIITLGMQSPADLRTKLYHLPELSDTQAIELQQQLSKLTGVCEALVVTTENMACLKVDIQEFDESVVEQLIAKGI